MKNYCLLFTACLCAGVLSAQSVRVLSDVKVADGWYPHLSDDATSLAYLAAESDEYGTTAAETDLYVTNEDLKLVLYKQGVRTELYPHGTNCNYIWASLSPDATRILFNTKFGTGICDLTGKALVNLGNLDAPVWYGNDYVVGMYDTHDGHNYTSSSIALCSVDGTLKQVLTNPQDFGMYPSVSARTGQIAYNTLSGEVRLMQTNLTDMPIRKSLPCLQQAVPAKKARKVMAGTQADFKDFRIYINPGHGGHDADDRNVKIYPFASGDPEGFWESNSNLDKGLKLRDWLNELGFQTMMSRVTNTTADDRALSAIVAEANTYKADFMLSIHSNAGGPSNYVLQLYAGVDVGDTHIYPTATPCSDESRAISTIIGNNILSNQITTWTAATPRITGDKTFGRTAMGWSNGYGVLRGLKVPGVISEGRMHDYLPEAYRLMNMDYKWEEAWQFMQAFCTYFMHYEQPVGVIGGQVRDSYQQMVFPAINKIRGSRDELLPINRAEVSLWQNGQRLQTYTTDTLYNGVFFFWNLQPGTYTLKVQAEHYYDAEQEVVVTKNKITYQDMLMNMQRETRPEVIGYSPNVGPDQTVDVSTEVVLSFNWDMVAESLIEAFSISPEVEGSITFENSYRTMRFTPTRRFEKDTEYTVTLAKTACHPDYTFTNTMAEDFSFKFTTKNRSELSLLQSYPSAESAPVPVNPSFILIWDEVLNTGTVKKNITIQDMQGNTQSVNARTYSYDAPVSPNGFLSFELTKALQPDTEYKVVIAEDLRDQLGIYYNKTTEIPFRTEQPQELTLPVVNDAEALAFKFDGESSLYTKNASVFLNTNKKVRGSASNELIYAFTDKEGTAMYDYVATDNIISTNQGLLGMYVFADFSENELYAKWDASGDIQYTLLCVMDYAGWKYVETDLSRLPAGVEYQFMGLQLRRNNGFLSERGSIYVDDIRFDAVATALDDVETVSICLSPNPVKDVLTVQGVENCNLSLYAPDGRLISTVKGNTMDMSGLAQGVYMLGISTDGKQLWRNVIKN
ncbi:MAG: Ig-like domain-containing protein [Paludibacter sp.]|nr:Ig-like domain-containing protein [Bacteroidales bacterium]MCM1069879.1 Ig-like domain-containing protein [Prevotella sp.]MCM1353048.1 Ig-like domain-containing protein [Bacteroides sp.]MCM1443405.1 Ig-like domain-containing protein [Muribaculum sp.]MCM1481213.1 Ig-like domain-containing protein [Paludibacter sp.]